MDKQIKAKWVAALRSGDYQQEVEALRFNRGYCCLGVLADVLDSSGWRDEGDLDYSWKGASATIPYDVAFSLGIADAIDDLMHMNDTDKKSFSEIADYIEANL